MCQKVAEISLKLLRSNRGPLSDGGMLPLLRTGDVSQSHFGGSGTSLELCEELQEIRGICHSMHFY
jgi:hypothetical protein